MSQLFRTQKLAVAHSHVIQYTEYTVPGKPTYFTSLIILISRDMSTNITNLLLFPFQLKSPQPASCSFEIEFTFYISKKK